MVQNNQVDAWNLPLGVGARAWERMGGQGNERMTHAVATPPAHLLSRYRRMHAAASSPTLSARPPPPALPVGEQCRI